MKVAVAIVFDNEQRVLITRRPLHAAHGGMWEFPGGKLEAGELPSEALVREIKEEVGIEIVEYSFLGEVTHTYGDKTVTLLVFRIEQYQGNAICCESQIDLCWVSVNNLVDYTFPEANLQIINLIQKNCLVANM